MSFDSNIARGRLDLLLYGLCEVFVRQNLQPHMQIDIDLWNDLGLNKAAAYGIAGLGIPQGQIQAVRIGQLQIPMPVVEKFGRAVLNAGQPKQIPNPRRGVQRVQR